MMSKNFYFIYFKALCARQKAFSLIWFEIWMFIIFTLIESKKIYFIKLIW